MGLDPERRTTGLPPIRAQGFGCGRQLCRSLQRLRRRDPGRGNYATIAARIAEDTF